MDRLYTAAKVIAYITDFMRIEQSCPLSVPKRYSLGTIITINEAMHEIRFNLSKVKKIMVEIPLVRQSLLKNRQFARDAASRGELPRFCDSDFVLDTREEFYIGENLALRCINQTNIVKAL